MDRADYHLANAEGQHTGVRRSRPGSRQLADQFSDLLRGRISAGLIIIGIPILFVLGILAVVFPIIGAIKAYNGELWEYPMAIRFV